MTEDNRSIYEIFAEAGHQWADAKARADILEDTETAHRSQMILELQEADPSLAFNKAEARAKASKEYIARVHERIEARRKANHLWVKMESLRMAHGHYISSEANERLVAKL